ncbi:MAG: hypothetical protein JNM42_05190 [Propionivibrio sp.]|mgnify:FL=1|uniref:hypothetical protein n=1 Tax=Propionivibrio sp. TaxID=2212460 RepID=UPI001A50DC67|nr:hypothetical protein [Propionivibrio sp.]MBL8413814.1 hypothetical protein [Propionivibrio sp.]
MPITPFHFGPGAVIHVLAPRHVSFLAFCAANVLIDIEPLYYMLAHQERLHRFFHTYVGASLVALATFALFLACRWFARLFWLPNPFQWQSLSLLAVAIGAAAGTCSHIVLDSVMHFDITPFAPFSDANPLFRVTSLPALHWFCLGSGAMALLILGVRRVAVSQNAR